MKPNKSNSYKWTRFGPNVKGLEPTPAQLVCASRASGLGKFPAHDGPFNVANKRRPRPGDFLVPTGDSSISRAPPPRPRRRRQRPRPRRLPLASGGDGGCLSKPPGAAFSPCHSPPLLGLVGLRIPTDLSFSSRTHLVVDLLGVAAFRASFRASLRMRASCRG